MYARYYFDVDANNDALDSEILEDMAVLYYLIIYFKILKYKSILWNLR